MVVFGTHSGLLNSRMNMVSDMSEVSVNEFEWHHVLICTSKPFLLWDVHLQWKYLWEFVSEVSYLVLPLYANKYTFITSICLMENGNSNRFHPTVVTGKNLSLVFCSHRRWCSQSSGSPKLVWASALELVNFVDSWNGFWNPWLQKYLMWLWWATWLGTHCIKLNETSFFHANQYKFFFTLGI